MISFNAIDVEMPAIAPERIRRWIATVASRYTKDLGDINYIFVSEPHILSINQRFLQHDYYTDIITFDYTERNIIAGDIYISTGTVASNATLMQTPYEEELHRVIIHGVLHLCGINDKGKGERKKMVEAENNALSLLRSI